MRPRCAFEIPGVIGIAPTAVEIAARSPHEDCGKAGRNALTLKGVKDFGTVVELGEFHAGTDCGGGSPACRGNWGLIFRRVGWSFGA